MIILQTRSHLRLISVLNPIFWLILSDFLHRYQVIYDQTVLFLPFQSVHLLFPFLVLLQD